MPWMLIFLNNVVYPSYVGAQNKFNVGRTIINWEVINLPKYNLYMNSINKIFKIFKNSDINIIFKIFRNTSI
jgi:hypothetical protein